MREVAVIGVGMTQFGKHTDRSIRELGEEALWATLQDAGMTPKSIQVAYVGNAMSNLSGQGMIAGQMVLRELGITSIPITRIENACASASFAFRESWLAVASGLYDVALAVGFEKMTSATSAEVIEALAGASDTELEASLGITFPGVFAMVARRHMYQYGTTREQMAQVSVKNHDNGSLNPRSQYQKRCTVEEVLASRPIARPLNLLDCCPISDGAAAAVLVAKDLVPRYSTKPIWIAASGQASGAFEPGADITIFKPTIMASQSAYKMAGLGPQDIDLAEVHDCFTIAEVIHTEDLGFAPKGEGGPFIQEGNTAIGGRIPINTSGGLLAKGHPVGATGLAQIVEIVEQLRGQSGPRQVEGAKAGLAMCLGGFMHSDAGAVAVHILKA
ncbi:MAG: thiolase domain-containing protein [Dehalococcoidia bacterium]|nr:thiolase domain-containing protein [Dehalococcoidia bacterium]